MTDFKAAAKAVRAPLVALTVGAIALAGCGGSSSSSSTSTSAPATSSSSSGGTPSGALTVSANPEGQLKYDKSSLSASAGSVTIAFTNSSPLPHNLTIESSSGSKVGATPTFQGGTKTLTANLKAGTYKFFCTVPGHRQAGMEGTLTVR